MNTTKNKSKDDYHNSIIGNNVYIGENVTIGNNCIIGNNVVIHDGTLIGSNVRIDDNTILGKKPLKSPMSATTTSDDLGPLVIGDDVLIGANVIIYRGAKVSSKVLIADLSTVREHVTIEKKTIVGRNVAIENYCTIGKHCKLETNVYITAHSTIDDYVFVAPGVLTSNDNFVGRTKERFKHFEGVHIKKGARIGVGAVILPGKTIDEDALVAAGALVTKDIPKKQIWAGIPARYFKDVPKEQLLKNQDFYEG
ncbi:MAG: N-acetyltransferase [Nitrospiraceae bacterium]|nr:N-acetyltransferase [Nitrospiraceae bacterium]